MAAPRPDFNDNQKSALVELMIAGRLSIERACALYGLSREQLEEWVCIFRREVREALDQQLRDTLAAQGLELDEIARPEFSGSLVDLRVDEVLQTAQLGRKDAHITVTHGAEVSEIWCRAGEVVDAHSGALEGERAFHRVLALERGRIVADFAPNDRARRIEQSTPRLLLEVASRTGLRARVAQRIGDPALVFTIDGDATARRAGDFEPDELDLLRLFDGARSVEEVIATSTLSDARALEVIASLRERRLLVACAHPLDHSPTLDPAPPSSQLAMSYRPFVASLAPQPAHLSAWWLASGAVLCSSLGAVAAIAYATRGSGVVPRTALDPASVSASAVIDDASALTARAPMTLPASIAGRAMPATRECPRQMAWIAGGEFRMGSDSDRPALSLARPAHQVSIDGYCIGVHEVTVREYVACSQIGDCTPAHRSAHFATADGEVDESTASVSLHGVMCNAGKADRDEHPINCVSHAQALSFCRAHGYRLPTEAEWEFAARGTASRPFPWGNARPSHERINACGPECKSWYVRRGLEADLHGTMYPTSDGYSGTAPVGSFPLGTTPEGVSDLIGNVFEWTADGLYDYDAAQVRNPRGPLGSASFVIRGGNFNSGVREFADPALRFAMHGDSYSHGVGFRCAADARGDGTPSVFQGSLERAARN